MSFVAIKFEIQNNFSSILIVALFAGIFCPGLDRIPSNSVIVIMATIIFLACTNIDRADLAVVSLGEAILFYVVRFVALPVLLFYLARSLVPEFALGVLLMALMPAGVSSVALASLFGGSVSLALGVTVLSTALTPIAVPLLFEVLSDASVEIDTYGMFCTLSALIFVPLVADRILEKAVPEKRSVLRENSAWLSVILIGIMVALVIGKYQNQLWQEPELVVSSLLILLLEFSIFYFVGWYFVRGNSTQKKVSYAVCSGANNCALAAALAFLYLSPVNGIFSVLSEIPWVLALIPFKKYLVSSSK